MTKPRIHGKSKVKYSQMFIRWCVKGNLGNDHPAWLESDTVLECYCPVQPTCRQPTASSKSLTTVAQNLYAAMHNRECSIAAASTQTGVLPSLAASQGVRARRHEPGLAASRMLSMLFHPLGRAGESRRT
jgi:hypothetical protein